jgi:signal transduction histidine kinase
MNAFSRAVEVPAEAVAGIFHDLRNILASLELSVERLDQRNDPAARELGTRLRQHVELAGLLSQAGAQIVNGRPREDTARWHDLRAIVERARELLGPADKLQIDVRVEAGESVYGRDFPLLRALYNLLANSAKAGAGVVTVQLAKDGRRVALVVRDTGPGLPPSVREDPFAIRSREDGRRLSVGLWLARMLMRGEGGDVELLSTGSDGTTFVLVLPG